MTVKPEHAVYTLVVGLGKTGLSVVRYLRALGEQVVVVDSRDIPPGITQMKKEFEDVQCVTGGFENSLFRHAARIIVSPGVPLSEPVLVEARNNNIEIIGDIDLFAREANAPVIGITGSNGKSTVTTLLTEMTKQCGINAIAAGNIGLPVLDALHDEIELYVLELSSFQLETLQRLPMKAAVVLNISADHLDRYENLAAYAMSKQVIYENAEIFVINKDDELAGKICADNRQVIEFTLWQPGKNSFGLFQFNDGEYICRGEHALLATSELKLKGRHNIQNVLASLALGYALSQELGLSMDKMLEALKSFTGLAHRTQFVAEKEGVTWINDSKATNVGAAIAAMKGLPGKHILIAGGIAKDADFSDLAEVVRQHCHAVVLIGQDAEQIKAVLDTSVPVVFASDMGQVVRVAQDLARKLAVPGDNVLLSPACASFDMFDNFEQRGDAFMQSVRSTLK